MNAPEQRGTVESNTSHTSLHSDWLETELDTSFFLKMITEVVYRMLVSDWLFTDCSGLHTFQWVYFLSLFYLITCFGRWRMQNDSSKPNSYPRNSWWYFQWLMDYYNFRFALKDMQWCLPGSSYTNNSRVSLICCWLRCVSNSWLTCRKHQWKVICHRDNMISVQRWRQRQPGCVGVTVY